MEVKLGNSKQIILSIVLLGVVGFATISTHVSNVHLAFTIIIGLLHIYLGAKLSDNKVKPANNLPASAAYMISFAANAIISFAFSWWFSGIVWVYVLCIYIAANNQQDKKEENKSNEGEVA